MKYTTIAVLSLQAGVVLGLSEAQAAARVTVLAPVPDRKGWYTTTGPVQFKRGEMFLHDGDLPKHLADGVETPDGDKPKAAAPKGKSKAKAQQTQAPAPEPVHAADSAADTTAGQLALE